MNHNIRTAAERVAETAAMPGMKQWVGTWRENGRCCAGARLAHALSVPSGGYVDGMRAFARSMGCNEAQLILLLRQAGAGHNPFGAWAWPNKPAEVWRNLMEIEDFPETRGTKLSLLNMDRATMPQADLAGANLAYTILSRADLRRADLSGADLSGADLSGANLAGANLAGANLSDANLKGADLTGANLAGADLTLATLAGARLEGPELERAKLRMTNLKNTVLDPHRGEHGPLALMARLARKLARLLTRTAKPQNSPSPEDEGIPGNGTAGTETAGTGTAGTGRNRKPGRGPSTGGRS